MWVSVDLCVVAIGVGISLSPYIAACERVIAATGLTHQLGPKGHSDRRPVGRGDGLCAGVPCRVARHGSPASLHNAQAQHQHRSAAVVFDKVASVEQLLGD